MLSYIGNICVFGFDFAPYKWLPCQGQILSKAQYGALFALLGATYGGNGTTTFGLPNLQGRTAVGTSTDGSYKIGSTGGNETAKLDMDNLPAHTHGLSAQLQIALVGSLTDPTGKFPAATDGTSFAYNSTQGATPVNMAPAAVSIQSAGGTDSFNIQSPYLNMLHCICLDGPFPSRP